MVTEKTGMHNTIVSFSADDSKRMDIARHIRKAVFCEEQGVSAEDEWDGKDHICEHFLIESGNTAVGTARVRPYGPSIYKVERVAVLKHLRSQGAGKAIMDYILNHLSNSGTIVLNAQTQVEEFYLRLGFAREGSVFEEAGITHVHMIWRQ